MEALFADRVGVISTEVGWIQADRQHKRRQAVLVEYNEQQISYGNLLTLYWSAIDAQDGAGQFCDRGSEYSPALYVQTPLQQRWAKQSRAKLALELGERLPVRILPVGTYESASARQQHYYRRHTLLYAGYRRVCGYPAASEFTLPARANTRFSTNAQFD